MLNKKFLTIIYAGKKINCISNNVSHWSNGSQSILISIHDGRSNKKITKIFNLGEQVIVFYIYCMLYYMLFYWGLFSLVTAFSFILLNIYNFYVLKNKVFILIVSQIQHFSSEVTVRF